MTAAAEKGAKVAAPQAISPTRIPQAIRSRATRSTPRATAVISSFPETPPSSSATAKAAGVALVYGTLFGMGALVLPGGWTALPCLATAVGCGLFLYRRFAVRGWAAVAR